MGSEMCIRDRATFNALIELNRTRINDADRQRLNITEGRNIG